MEAFHAMRGTADFANREAPSGVLRDLKILAGTVSESTGKCSKNV